MHQFRFPGRRGASEYNFYKYYNCFIFKDYKSVFVETKFGISSGNAENNDFNCASFAKSLISRWDNNAF